MQRSLARRSVHQLTLPTRSSLQTSSSHTHTHTLTPSPSHTLTHPHTFTSRPLTLIACTRIAEQHGAHTDLAMSCGGDVCACAQDVAFNVKFEEADFKWSRRVVHGTKMSAAYWVVHTTTGKVLKVEYNTTSKVRDRPSPGGMSVLLDMAASHERCVGCRHCARQ